MFSKNDPVFYQIEIDTPLDPNWENWFEGLKITLLENGHTLLRGPIKDQAALRGSLEKLWDLNCEVVCLHKVGKNNID